MSTRIDVSKCIGCGECIEVCPASPAVYKIDKKKKAVIKHPNNCIDCGACVTACPENAIKEND